MLRRLPSVTDLLTLLGAFGGSVNDKLKMHALQGWLAPRTVAAGFLAAAGAVLLLTDAQGLVSVLVLLAAFGVAAHSGRWAGAAVAAASGAVFVAVNVSIDRTSGLGAALTVLAILIWVFLAWAAGAAADERRQMNEQLTSFVDELSHRALHDRLTGLANRELLLDRLEHALQRRDRHPSRLAVLFLDVDDFKLINDTLGHSAGDALLVEIAQRMVGQLRETDTAARLGGDEFVIVCEDLGDDQEALAIAERVASALAEPFRLDKQALPIRASIGIALPTSNDQHAEQLLQHADQAMYLAKQRGGGRFDVFNEELRQDALERINTETDLRRALANNELRLLYQPILDLRDKRVSGFEALLRWEHPSRGLLAPADFLAVAENSSLIVPVGAWALEQACAQVAELTRRTADPSLTMSINLSARQLSDGSFGERLRTALARSGADPRQIHLEVTETALLEAPSAATAQLEAAAASGVRVGLDDFGTGYSSLSLLKRFPVSFLKIDESFVHGIGQAGDEAAIAGIVIDLSRSLGVDTIAEGIETNEQLRGLRQLGCRYGQGYYFAAPQPASALETFVLQRPHSASVPGRRPS